MRISCPVARMCPLPLPAKQAQERQRLQLLPAESVSPSVAFTSKKPAAKVNRDPRCPDVYPAVISLEGDDTKCLLTLAAVLVQIRGSGLGSLPLPGESRQRNAHDASLSSRALRWRQARVRAC